MSAKKGNTKLIRLGLIYAVVIALLAYFIPKQHNWMPSFSKEYDWPFASNLIHDEMRQIFNIDSSNILSETHYIELKEKQFQNHNLVIINQGYYPDSLDLDQLYRFVSDGNNAFLASDGYSTELLDSLGIRLEYQFNSEFSSLNSAGVANLSLNFYSDKLKTDSNYLIKAERYYDYFVQEDSLKEVYKIGHISEGQVCFVRIPFGEGNFYLHSLPFVFTNYHLLKDGVSSYIAKCFSQMPRQMIIWDEYYKVTRELTKQSPMHVMMQSKPFRWAYWLFIVGLVLFIVFHAKRKQRIIPVLKPYRNESLKFAKTISALYFQNRNNKDLALKRINYLREYLASRYHMLNMKFSEDDAHLLHEKSGLNKDLLVSSFNQIREYKSLEKISDNQLKVLSKRINKIYQRK